MNLRDHLRYQAHASSRSNVDPFAEYEAAFSRLALCGYLSCHVIFCPNDGSVLVAHKDLPLAKMLTSFTIGQQMNSKW
jgi:hypothetical protein